MKMLGKLTFITLLTLTAPALAGDHKEKSAQAPSATNNAPTRETSLGTIRLFIQAMHKGDFHEVVELSDPTCEAYKDLQDMAAAFDPATANPNMDKAMLDAVRGFFTKPWADVEPKLVVEQGPRAQYTLTYYYIDDKTKERKQGETRTVDLNQFDGKWFVLATGQLIKPAVPTKLPEPPPASKPAPQKPTDQPAEQPGKPE